jgi:AraC-like DNA-binding protein
MELRLNWITLLNITGVIIGVFFCLIILGLKKGRKITRRFIAAFILMYSFELLNTVIYYSKLILVYPHLSRVFSQVYFTLGPLFYLYVKSLTEKHFKLKAVQLLHFLPFCLGVIYIIPFYIQSAEYKIQFYLNFPIRTDIGLQILLVSRFVQLFLYILFTIKLLGRHSIRITHSYSSIDKIHLTWIKFLVLMFIFGIILYLMAYFTLIFFPGISNIPLTILYICRPLIILFVGYKGLTQPEIFSDDDPTVHAGRYKQSTLTEEQAENYLAKLLEFMKKEKPFLKDNLTAKELAHQVGISYRHLSQIINEKLQQNFFDFINRYRVEEAKKLLAREKDKRNSILAIAYDAGFNSKTTFYTVFKKYEHRSPSQFIKENVPEVQQD